MRHAIRIKRFFVYAAFAGGLAIAAGIYKGHAGSARLPAKENFMEANELEKAIREHDSSLLTREKLASIEKKEYPFYKDYVHSTADSKGMLITVLRSVNQPWCYKYYLEMLKDPDYQIRIPAAEGISGLTSGGEYQKSLAEIERQNASPQEDRAELVSNLVLAIGTTREPKALEPLLGLFQNEKDPNIRIAYQQATAKLGYKKTLREIELELLTGDGPGNDEALGKQKALQKVEYMNDPVWIEKVKPLLLDERIGRTAPLGPFRKVSRVCDLAIDVLRKIDSEKKIQVVEPIQIGDAREKLIRVQYAPAELEQFRKAYGMGEKGK